MVILVSTADLQVAVPGRVDRRQEKEEVEIKVAAKN
jgi:hypothetical protein